MANGRINSTTNNKPIEDKLSFTAKDLSIGLALMKVSKLGTLKKKVEIKHKCVLKTFLLKVIIKCEIILLC